MKNKSNPPRNQAQDSVPQEILRKLKKRSGKKIPRLTEEQAAILSADNLHEWVKNDPKDFFKRMPPSVIRLFENMVGFLSEHRLGFKKQKTSGREIGNTRETANRAFGKLVKYGLVNKAKRTNHPNLYTLSSYFNDPKVRKRFAKYISAFNCIFLAVSLLASNITQPAYIEKVHVKKDINGLLGLITHSLNTRYIYNSSLRNKRVMSENSDLRGVNSGRNVQRVQNATPEVRLRALAKDHCREEEKMRQKANANLKALFDQGHITAKQLEKMIK